MSKLRCPKCGSENLFMTYHRLLKVDVRKCKDCGFLAPIYGLSKVNWEVE